MAIFCRTGSAIHSAVAKWNLTSALEFTVNKGMREHRSLRFSSRLCTLWLVMILKQGDKTGELILTSECSRYQFRNLADCLQKIRDMIAKASQTATEPSKEDALLHRLRCQKVPQAPLN